MPPYSTIPNLFQVRVGLSPSTGSRDLTAQEILFVLEQMAKDEFDEDSCFGCAVLSHASENEAILGVFTVKRHRSLMILEWTKFGSSLQYRMLSCMSSKYVLMVLV